MSGPDNILQFRSPPRRDENPFYMGGTAIGCGDHPSVPPRHWWGAWKLTHGGGGRERMCRRCGLWSDTEWLDGDAA